MWVNELIYSVIRFLVSQYITDIFRAEQGLPVFIGLSKNLTELRVFKHDSITRCLIILHFFLFCIFFCFHAHPGINIKH